MAIVLVAAVVVPVAVIPGTFGFEAWPSSHGDRITEHRVQEKPRLIKVVQDGPARAADTPRRASLVRKPAAARGATQFVAGTSPAPAPRESTRFVATTPGHEAGGRGRGNGNPSSPDTPSTPASEPDTAAGQNGSPSGDQVTSGDSPVLRDDQPETPAAPQSPVEPEAPAPVAPAPTPQAGRDCDGGGDQDGGANRRAGVVGGIVPGVGSQLGFGHPDR